MRHLKLFSIALLSGIILLACSGTSADKTTNSSDPGGGASGSGKDMYYEYTTTSGSSNMTIKMDTKMYVSSDGGMRMEMTMDNSAMKGKGPVTIVTIGHSDKPNESISIDDATKTYSINHIDTADLHVNDGSNTKYSVSKIGEETITGFNGMHARIIAEKVYNGPAKFMNSIDTTDLWLSPDVPVPASVKKYMDMAAGKMSGVLFNADVANQLKQMGCEGFMTKMEIHTKHSSTTEVLVKVEHRDLPASMFQVPAGYKEDKNAGF